MARKKKGEFVSALGVGFEIIKKISDTIRALGGEETDLRRILTDDRLVWQIAEVIMGKIQDTYEVIVNYSKTFQEIIFDGSYDHVDGKITDDHFPISGVGQKKIELVLLHLGRDVTTKEARKILSNLGLVPARMEHLLAFGAQYSEQHFDFSITALGTSYVSKHSEYFTKLVHHNHERSLKITWTDKSFVWHDRIRFLAVHK
jgi:hypothetical protein